MKAAPRPCASEAGPWPPAPRRASILACAVSSLPPSLSLSARRFPYGPSAAGLGLRGRPLGLRLRHVRHHGLLRDRLRAPATPARRAIGASDAPTDSSSPALDAPSDGSCHPLTASDTDIYVDSRFAGTPQTGALACPLHTILEGITAANMLGGPRTVHVAGSAPALVYDESGAVTVGAGITLLGDGSAADDHQRLGRVHDRHLRRDREGRRHRRRLHRRLPERRRPLDRVGQRGADRAQRRGQRLEGQRHRRPGQRPARTQHLRQRQRRRGGRVARGRQRHAAHRGRREHVQRQPRQRRGSRAEAPRWTSRAARRAATARASASPAIRPPATPSRASRRRATRGPAASSSTADGPSSCGRACWWATRTPA